MAFTVSDFTDYIKANPEIDITDVVLNLSSIEAGLNVQQGIKYKAKLVIMEDGSTEIQVGDYTATDASGGVVISDKDISTIERHVKEVYKPQVLQQKITQLVMAAGSEITDIPAFVKDEIFRLKNAAISKKNEQSLWVGDTTLTTTAATRHLKDFDGFIKLAQDADDTIKTALAGVALTASTAEAKVKLVTSLLHGDLIMEPTTLFMNPSNFQIFRGAMITKYVGQQSFSDQIGASFEYKIPGTEITARAMTGLVGSNDMLLCKPDNLTIGVDLLGEDESGEMRMLENRSFEFFALYKLGAQIGNEKYIVVTKASA